jgi:aerobic carbon-monoxide dehydrogenase small subunit
MPTARPRRSSARSAAAKRARSNRVPLRLTVNGAEYTRDVEPRLLLVDFLRDHLRLTGTHIGCDTGHCGACTVLLDDRAVKSCSLFAVQAQGSTVTTIEGLGSDGTLHPVQQAFREKHGLQCGFCTPGVVLAAVQLLRERPHPSEEEIRHGISGNICRCTGYVNIVRAVQAAANTAGRGR